MDVGLDAVPTTHLAACRDVVSLECDVAAASHNTGNGCGGNGGHMMQIEMMMMIRTMAMMMVMIVMMVIMVVMALLLLIMLIMVMTKLYVKVMHIVRTFGTEMLVQVIVIMIADD